jgi:GNAT superfamily N-acetyltransferase
MNDAIVVTPVTDKKGKRDFLDAPFTVHANDPNWVAPLYLERDEHLDPRKNPYFQHADVQLFVAYKGGKSVGRISAQNDHLRLKTLNDNKGMFGFLDSIDDPKIFSALVKAAGDWLRAKGRTGMIGPFSFSINDEMGLLIDGFDSPPNMMMGHGKPYYAPRMEELGFTKAKDVIAYHYDLNPNSLPILERVQKRAMASGDVSLRPIKMSDMKNEIRLIMDIFNDAWSNNWGFVPWTEAELDKLGKDLKLLVNGNYGYIASYKGEAAAFVVTLPNLNDWIKGMNGRILPFNWFKLLRHVIRKKPTSLRMPLMGVRRKFHGTPMGSALSTIVIEAARKYHVGRGGRTAELSWILEDNFPVRRLIETFGGLPYKTYRIYEKAL